MNQTIPITLTPGVAPTNIPIGNFQQLLAAICQYVAGNIRADVSFIQFVLNTPTTNVGPLIFNTNQGIFRYWDSNTGRYEAVQPYALGDIMNTVVGTDTVDTGWVVLNGRAITAIPGITTAQKAVLDGFFPGGTLPDVVPANVSNLPAEDSFSGITKPVVLPADGVIGALPISASYDELEVEALRDATEVLRDATASVEEQVSQIQDKSSDLLTALRVPFDPPLYAKIFVGYQA